MYMHHNVHNRVLGIAALLLALSLVPLAWSQQPLQVQEQQGVTFVSGGFGKDERGQLQDMQGQFNLKLVFATDAGNYLAGIDVRIIDQQGGTLVETRSDGPILMARLPARSYTVVASHKNNEQQRTVNVGNQGRTELNFTWSAE
jgi:hypothetical protein